MLWHLEVLNHQQLQCWLRMIWVSIRDFDLNCLVNKNIQYDQLYPLGRNLPIKCLHMLHTATKAYEANTWASCQIRKIAGAHARGMPGTFSPSPQVSDPDMHHGTCVTHVPWYMPGSLTSGFLWNRRWGKTFPAFPAHAQPAILRFW